MDSLAGQTLVKADGSSVMADSALAGKDLVLYYFSAHWCPPCRQFTPMLKDWYEVWLLVTLLTHVYGDDVVGSGGGPGDCLHLLWQITRGHGLVHEGVSWWLDGCPSQLCCGKRSETEIWSDLNSLDDKIKMFFYCRHLWHPGPGGGEAGWHGGDRGWEISSHWQGSSSGCQGLESLRRIGRRKNVLF